MAAPPGLRTRTAVSGYVQLFDADVAIWCARIVAYRRRIGLPIDGFDAQGPPSAGSADRPARTQPTVVPDSKPCGMAESFFSALNSSVAWVLFHSTESPALV